MNNSNFLKIIILISFILFTNISFSQKTDTTELKMGDKRILIIEEGEEIEQGISDLRKGIVDFKIKIKNYQNNIHELEDSITIYNEQLKNASTEQEKAEIQKKINNCNAEIEDHSKKIEAFENGIDQIETEINELTDKLDELAGELNDDYDDMDNEFNLDDFTKNRRKKFKGHWAGFEFGINNYFDNNFQMQLPADGKFMELNTNKSWGFGLNFMQYSLPLYSKYIGIVTGMGFEWNNFRLKQNINLIEDSLGIITSEAVDESVMKYTKNSLNMLYFNVPLIFEFQIPTGKKDKRFFIGVGGYGSVKLASKTKKFYELNGDSRDLKFKGDYQLSPFRYGLTTRLGYEFIELYANYSLATLFEKNQGPELYPFTVGLRIDF